MEDTNWPNGEPEVELSRAAACQKCGEFLEKKGCFGPAECPNGHDFDSATTRIKSMELPEPETPRPNYMLDAAWDGEVDASTIDAMIDGHGKTFPAYPGGTWETVTRDDAERV